MDVHIGREAVTSWKDFFVRYLLIAAGILSAWAVNQWNESRQNHRIAEQTRAALHAELANDLKELREAIAFDERQLRAAGPFRQRLIAALVAHVPERQIDKQIVGAWSTDLRDQYPTLRRDAWDAAIAGQAVTHLGAEELRRFSGAYAAMHDITEIGVANLSGSAVELRRRFVDWELDRRIGRHDAAELARLLLLWATVEASSVQQLRALDQALAEALQRPPLAGDADPATAAASAPDPAASR